MFENLFQSAAKPLPYFFHFAVFCKKKLLNRYFYLLFSSFLLYISQEVFLTEKTKKYPRQQTLRHKGQYAVVCII